MQFVGIIISIINTPREGCKVVKSGVTKCSEYRIEIGGTPSWDSIEGTSWLDSLHKDQPR